MKSTTHHSVFFAICALAAFAFVSVSTPLSAQDLTITTPVTYIGLDTAQNLPPLKLTRSPLPEVPARMRDYNNYYYAIVLSPSEGQVARPPTSLHGYATPFLATACSGVMDNWRWDPEFPKKDDPRRAWVAIIFNPASAPATGATAKPRLLSVTPMILPPSTDTTTLTGVIAWADVIVGASGEIKNVHVPITGRTSDFVRQHKTEIEKTVYQWKFAPARDNDTPVEARTRVQVTLHSALPDTKTQPEPAALRTSNVRTKSPSPSMKKGGGGIKKGKGAPPTRIASASSTSSTARNAPSRPPPSSIGPLRPIIQVDAAYPKSMRDTCESGIVTLEFTLDGQGRPQNPVVVLSPDKRFDKPALDAIRKYVFDLPDFTVADSLGKPRAKLTDARWQYEINFAPPRQVMTKVRTYNYYTYYSCCGGISTRRTLGPLVDKLVATTGTRAKGQNVTRPVLAPAGIKPVAPVYPYELLAKNTTGSATVRVPRDTAWSDGCPEIIKDTDKQFGYALAAAVRYYTITPAHHDGKPAPSMPAVTLDFKPANPALQLPPKTMQLLADEKKNPAKIIPADKLDSPLKFEEGPRPATLNVNDEMKGITTIEFLIDETGRVHLPRIIETKTPEVAYILMQQISLRTYTPPTQNGTPVTARARETVDFDNPSQPPPAK